MSKRLSVMFEGFSGENGNMTIGDLPDTVTAEAVGTFLAVVKEHSNAVPISFKLTTSTIEGTYVGGTPTDAKHSDVDSKGKYAYKIVDDSTLEILGSRTLSIPAPKDADYGTDGQALAAAKTAIGAALAVLTGETLKGYGAWLEVPKIDILKVA